MLEEESLIGFVSGGGRLSAPDNATPRYRAEFLQIFKNCCQAMRIEYREDVIEQLLVTYYRPRQIQLRGCHPRDLINQAISLAQYYGKPAELTAEVLEAACASYFVDDREAPPSYV